MLFDWFTFAAQLLNFIILVWLLKRFLYRPVLKAIDDREKKIADELQEAADSRTKTDAEMLAWKKKNSDLEAMRSDMLHAAEKAAAEQRLQMLTEARQEYDQLRGRLHETLVGEQATLHATIIDRIRTEVFHVAGKVLEDLADTGLEQQMAMAFCRRLRNEESENLEEIISILKQNGVRPVIKSTFSLPDEQRKMVRTTLRDVFGFQGDIDFDTADSSAGGISMQIDGHSIGWNIGTYLDALDIAAGSLLGEQPEKEGERNEGNNTERMP